jgi:hypothetical protein
MHHLVPCGTFQGLRPTFYWQTRASQYSIWLRTILGIPSQITMSQCRRYQYCKGVSGLPVNSPVASQQWYSPNCTPNTWSGAVSDAGKWV